MPNNCHHLVSLADNLLSPNVSYRTDIHITVHICNDYCTTDAVAVDFRGVPSFGVGLHSSECCLVLDDVMMGNDSQ